MGGRVLLEFSDQKQGQPALARIVRQFGDIRLDQLLVAVESTVPAATATRIV